MSQHTIVTFTWIYHRASALGKAHKKAKKEFCHGKFFLSFHLFLHNMKYVGIEKRNQVTNKTKFNIEPWNVC